MTKLGDYVFLLAHGAGAGMQSEFIQYFSTTLNNHGLLTIPFDFPYMQLIQSTGKRRPPDRMPKLVDYFESQIKAVHKQNPSKKIIIGGKSMGGRVASLVAYDQEQTDSRSVTACVCLGFPFHPPKKPEKYRGEHLAHLQTPTLIIQGERDPFGTRDEIINLNLSKKVQLESAADGDHSFKPRVKSGHTLDKNLDLASQTIIQFVLSLEGQSA